MLMFTHAFRRAVLSSGLALTFVAAVQRSPAATGDEHWDVQFGLSGTTNTLQALTLHDGRIYGGGYFAVPQLATNRTAIAPNIRYFFMRILPGGW